MVDRRMSTAEAATEVGASPNTVKSWLRDLPLAPERDDAGRHRWGADAIAALRTVKAMRDQGRTYDSIRITLAPPSTEVDEAVTPPSPAAEPQVSVGSPVVDPGVIAAVVAAHVLEAIRSDNQLALNLATAARRVGELEATVTHRDEQLVRIERERDNAEAERARLAGELAELRGRSWWRRLTGG